MEITQAFVLTPLLLLLFTWWLLFNVFSDAGDLRRRRRRAIPMSHAAAWPTPTSSPFFSFLLLCASAPQCFTLHDAALAGRPSLPSRRLLTDDDPTIATSPYGPRWRHLRRLATVHALSPHRLSLSSSDRDAAARAMARRLFRPEEGSDSVGVRSAAYGFVGNVIMEMVAGEGMGEADVARFKALTESALAASGAANRQDFLPFLRFLDFGRLSRRLAGIAKDRNDFGQGIVDDFRRRRRGRSSPSTTTPEARRTVVGDLLRLQESSPEVYGDDVIRTVCLSLLQAGTDTSASTIEWAMALLLNNPDVLKKATAEIDSIVGTSRLLQESDLAGLPYLRCIITETLRLYPLAPHLVPHEALQDCVIAGHDVPRGTMVLVDVFSMQRDPLVWENPEKFMPERFEGVKADERKWMMPFGMGRRKCPGEGLALRTVGIALGVMIQCFRWERVGNEKVDMSEGSGLTMPMAVPLTALCLPRVEMESVLKTLCAIAHSIVSADVSVPAKITASIAAAAGDHGDGGGAAVLVAIVFIAVLLLAVAVLVRSSWDDGGGAPAPPSSPAMPVIGHLHLMKKPLHHSLAALAGGEAMVSLRLGARRALLVSTHATAAACFAADDAALAGRLRLLAGDVLGYGYTTVVWASHGDHWRALRRFFAAELSSTAKSLAADRRADVASFVAAIAGDGGGDKVTLRPRLFELMLNVMLRAVTGRRNGGGETRRLQEMVESFAASGAPSVGDFFPALRWLDRLRGVEAALRKLQARRDAFVACLVDDHRRRHDAGDRDEDKKGIIDALLTLQETDPDHYTDNVIKGIVLVLLTAGTDTSALTIEWAMAQLLTHPETMKKARAEIDANVGTTRLVEEADMASLPYIQCVIKETLRLRPVAPVIPAHEAMEDCTVGGFHVRRGTMILVDAWAIHRDANVWDAPEELKPERFLDDADSDVVTAVTGPPMISFGLGHAHRWPDGRSTRAVLRVGCQISRCHRHGRRRRTVDADGGAADSCMSAPGVRQECGLCFYLNI
uniref:Cytochrome P450 n=1 Tax=Leersia perrieri TaxID=77586 RepID=A0A0D9Y0W7_9ORYZ